MSTLTLHIGRSIGATLSPGDEIVVTTLDHEANVTTWKAMAADRGADRPKVDIRPDDVTLDLEDLESKLSNRTKLVAVGYASNAVGTINPVAEIVARAHEVGALTYVDAVAFAPHGPMDVQALDTDLLVCSAYKWFGPHLGALYGKAEVLDALPAFKVRPAHDRFETGTASFESIAGTLAATDYLRDIGRVWRRGGGARRRSASERRRELVAGMIAIVEYERELVGRLIDGLGSLPGVTIHGIADRRVLPNASDRVRLDRRRPTRAAAALAARGIYAWDGDFYATGLIERLGKAEAGGVLRLGLVHYNTAEEVDRTLEALERIAGWHAVEHPRSAARGRSTRPSYDGSSDSGSAIRSPRIPATSTASSPRSPPDCVYEIVPTGQRWEGHEGARPFYSDLFGAFPDNAFALSEIVVGPQGVFEVATLTGTNQGPWAGVPPSGLAVSLEVLIYFPWDPVTERFTGERIWFDRGFVLRRARTCFAYARSG